MLKIKDAKIRELEGKYYGTIIDILFNDDTKTEIDIWLSGDYVPSERELRQCTGCEDWHNECRECFDYHTESETTYNICKIIVEALKKTAD